MAANEIITEARDAVRDLEERLGRLEALDQLPINQQRAIIAELRVDETIEVLERVRRSVGSGDPDNPVNKFLEQQEERRSEEKSPLMSA